MKQKKEAEEKLNIKHTISILKHLLSRVELQSGTRTRPGVEQRDHVNHGS